MTAIIATAAHSVETGHALSQDLFEHVAKNVNTLPQGASPADITQTVIENLKGFFDRAGKIDQKSHGTTEKLETQSFSNPQEQGGSRVTDNQLDQVIKSLGQMFDYAVEVQMVARGATQLSGTANTLIKGQ